MNHDDAINLLPAYIDKELSLSEAADFDLHMQNCSVCQNEYNEQILISTKIKTEAVYFKATPQFAKRIQMALPKDTSEKLTTRIWNFIGLDGWVNNSWANRSASMVSLVAIIICASLFFNTPSAQQKLTEELVANHIRSLEVDHLIDVVSTDQHTVKPWFNGKLDFSPPVIDFSPSGFSIEGGRLDYVAGRTVAVIIYRHNKHPINLYVWPSSDLNKADVHSLNRNGYSLAHWVINGMNYWAISDVEADHLISFSKKLYEELKATENK